MDEACGRLIPEIGWWIAAAGLAAAGVASNIWIPRPRILIGAWLLLLVIFDIAFVRGILADSLFGRDTTLVRALAFAATTGISVFLEANLGVALVLAIWLQLTATKAVNTR